MADEHSTKGDVEAVYYSTLASLDELPSYDARTLVVMNWLKYIILTEIDRKDPAGMNHPISVAMQMVTKLCEFSDQMMALPEKYIEHVSAKGGHSPCTCPHCMRRRAMNEERVNAAKANTH